MALEISEWDVVDYLETEEDMCEYLMAAVEEGDPLLLQVAIGDVARARGMTAIAEEANVGRESLYKSLSDKGNPSFQTVVKVLHALGIGIRLEPLKN